MARGDNNRDDRTKTLAIPILLDMFKTTFLRGKCYEDGDKVSPFNAQETACLAISTVAQKVMIAAKSN